MIKLIKNKDIQNCWICNNITKISLVEDYKYVDCFECLKCFDFYIDLNSHEFIIHLYNVIDFNDKFEVTSIRFSLEEDSYITLYIDHESGDDKTRRYTNYFIFNDKLTIDYFNSLNLKDYIFKILDNYKKNMLFI